MLGLTSVFGNLTQLRGFPGDQYLAFILPVTMMQAAGFSGAATGVNLARDIEQGWFDRLLVSPAPRWALLFSTVAGACVRAVVPIAFALILAFALGVGFPGVGALLLSIVLALGFAAVAACWATALAVHFKTQSAAPIMQAGVFVFVLFSTSYAPQHVLHGFMSTVARINPVTKVIEGVRQGFVGDVTWATTWPAFVVLALMAGALGALALWMLERTGR
jgi:ABC-2 type transport system permease protein